MRDFGSATNAHFSAGGGTEAHALMWITARNRSTGAPETIGLWTGGDVRDFVIGGVTRTYYGAGAMIGVETLQYRAGMTVQTQAVSLSPMHASVTNALRAYDPRLAPVEIHRAVFDGNGLLIGDPHLMFRGEVDQVEFADAAIGGISTATVTLTSAARALTRQVQAYRSDAGQRARRSDDRGFKYAGVSGSVPVYWGEDRADPPKKKSDSPASGTGARGHNDGPR